MRRKLYLFLGLLVLASLVLAGCQSTSSEATSAPSSGGNETEVTQAPAEATEAPTEAAEATEAPAAKEITVTIGFTQSQTGKYNEESSSQTQGLELWVKQVNDQGGIKLSDGTVVKFKTVYYDDESTGDKVQQLYTRLITEDKADFLISPYSSGLTSMAAVVSEQYGKIMLATGAASDSIYTKGYERVYQIYTPASRYLTGAVDLLKNLDPNLKKVAFVYENSKFSQAVVEAAKTYAEQQGYEVVLFEGYDPGTTDFGAFINKIADSGAEAVMGGGHFQDGSTFARQLYEKQLNIKYLALLVAPADNGFSELGDAAKNVVGPSQWEPSANYSPESAKAAGLAWFGPTSAEFTKAYEDAYGETPSYHAAGGYAAGLVLQKAILDADSVDPDKVKAALDNMDLLIFFGHIKFDTSEDAHGLQIGHEMVYVQWQDKDGKLVKEVVWPKEGATAEPVYPLR